MLCNSNTLTLQHMCLQHTITCSALKPIPPPTPFCVDSSLEVRTQGNRQEANTKPCTSPYWATEPEQNTV